MSATSEQLGLTGGAPHPPLSLGSTTSFPLAAYFNSRSTSAPPTEQLGLTGGVPHPPMILESPTSFPLAPYFDTRSPTTAPTVAHQQPSYMVIGSETLFPLAAYFYHRSTITAALSHQQPSSMILGSGSQDFSVEEPSESESSLGKSTLSTLSSSRPTFDVLPAQTSFPPSEVSLMSPYEAMLISPLETIIMQACSRQVDETLGFAYNPEWGEAGELMLKLAEILKSLLEVIQACCAAIRGLYANEEIQSLQAKLADIHAQSIRNLQSIRALHDYIAQDPQLSHRLAGVARGITEVPVVPEVSVAPVPQGEVPGHQGEDGSSTAGDDVCDFEDPDSEEEDEMADDD